MGDSVDADLGTAGSKFRVQGSEVKKQEVEDTSQEIACASVGCGRQLLVAGFFSERRRAFRIRGSKLTCMLVSPRSCLACLY